MRKSVRFVCIGLYCWAMALALSGCFLNPSPPPEYYLLPSPSQSVPSGFSRLNGIRLAVGPVTIPGYLDHLSILVRRPDAGMVYLTSKALWSEPLRSGITRVLCESMSQRLAGSGGAVYPLDSEMRSDWRLYINVVRFDGAPDEAVVLEMDWGLTNAYGEIQRMGRFSDSLKAGPELSDMIHTMSLLLEHFGNELAGELRRLPLPQKVGAR